MNRGFISTIFYFLTLALLAVATADKRWGSPTTSLPPTPPPVTTTITVTAPGPTVTSASDCTTSSIQCCQEVVDGTSDQANVLLKLLGIVLTDVDVLLGLDCSPVSVVGVGAGDQCSAHPVCCENNSIGGLLSIGCVPIIL